MPGLSDAIVKASRQPMDRTSYLSAAIVTVSVQGSGRSVATSQPFSFGGTFFTPPAGGVLQDIIVDTSGNPVPLHIAVSYQTAISAGTLLYYGGILQVFSLSDEVGDYFGQIDCVFIGRGYK